MLKATLSVLLLNAAQNVSAVTLESTAEVTLESRRAPRLSPKEVNELIDRDLETNAYEIGNG